jgi:hypothetical protein
MRLTIELSTENAAFTDGNAGIEVARILRAAADKIETWPGANEFKIGLRDINGNKVGALVVEAAQ